MITKTDPQRKCSRCQIPVFLTEDWTLWPWPDGEHLCDKCNDERHEQEDFNEVERRSAKGR